MVTDVSRVDTVPRFIDDLASTLSEESSSHEAGSSVSIKEDRDDAKGDVCYMSSQLAIEGVFPDNFGVTAKPWNMDDQPVQCDFLVDVFIKETVTVAPRCAGQAPCKEAGTKSWYYRGAPNPRTQPGAEYLMRRRYTRPRHRETDLPAPAISMADTDSARNYFTGVTIMYRFACTAQKDWNYQISTDLSTWNATLA
ncbi:hypothetical protein HPB50_028492 [Hyalomma asiaticum]|nr:hypothetical protein HPB50_028492 [Hyalomma asiaticum]